MSSLRGAVKKKGGHQHPASDEVREAVGEDMVKLNVMIPASARKELKLRATQEDRTLHDIVNKLVDAYLREQVNV